MSLKQDYKIKENKIIELVEGSITKYEADALVCPANADLEPLIIPGNLQFFFFKDGGKEIFEEAREIGENYGKSVENGLISSVPQFSAHITKAGRLPAKYVIHSVAVGFDPDIKLYCNKNVISKSVKNVLELGKKNNLNSIGFPALGTGLYDVPLEQCVEATINEFSKHLKGETSLGRLGLVLYGEPNFYVAKMVCDNIIT